MAMQGVWLPIVTPFRDDDVDYDSYRHLLHPFMKTTAL